MLFALVFLIISTLLFYNYWWKRRYFPPGPAPLPLIGNTFEISKEPPGYAPFQRWSKKYGPMFTVWFGENPVVVITDFGLIKDTFIKNGDAYAGRDFMLEINKLFKATQGVYGITRTEGEVWRSIRRFSLRSMRNLGVGGGNNRNMEKKILDCVGTFISTIIEEKSSGIQNHHVMPLADQLSGSVINQMLFGYAFVGETLKKFYELKGLLDENNVIFLTPVGQILISMPWLRIFPIFSRTFNQIDYTYVRLYEYIDKHIEEKIAQRKLKKSQSTCEEALPNNLQNKSNNEEERDDYSGLEDEDFLDVYLAEMEAALQRGDAKENGFDMETLRNLIFDLFAAGQETTTATISFMILYLLLDQRVQRKLHAELDRLCEKKGIKNLMDSQDPNAWFRENPITLSDRLHLPYLNAVINETQRLCNLVPINFNHRTMCEVEINGYKLPKETVIVPQICCVLFDEKVFTQPDTFSPERFIDENNQLKKFEEFIPFSVGKRQCVGEALAKNELFLFAANFFNMFWVLPADPMQPPSTEKLMLLSVVPNEYNCRLEYRMKSYRNES